MRKIVEFEILSTRVVKFEKMPGKLTRIKKTHKNKKKRTNINLQKTLRKIIYTNMDPRFYKINNKTKK